MNQQRQTTPVIPIGIYFVHPGQYNIRLNLSVNGQALDGSYSGGRAHATFTEGLVGSTQGAVELCKHHQDTKQCLECNTLNNATPLGLTRSIGDGTCNPCSSTPLQVLRYGSSSNSWSFLTTRANSPLDISPISNIPPPLFASTFSSPSSSGDPNPATCTPNKKCSLL